MWWTVVFLLLNAFCASEAELSKDVKQHPLFANMMKNSNLSEFFGIMQLNDDSNILANPRYAAMLFAPSNMAFQITASKIRFEKDEIFLGYHIVLNPPAFLVRDFPSELNPMAGNGRLYVTRTASGEVFVNNAKILPENTQVYNVPNAQHKKVLHVIDEVLVPLRIKPSNSDNTNSDNSIPDAESNPNVLGLLERYTDYELSGHQLSKFLGLIKQWNRTEMFRSPRLNTYFIPVDSGLNAIKRPIDGKIIDAHVVYDRVLFVNPTPENELYETAAFSDMAKVTVSFPREVLSLTKKRHQYVSSINTKPGNLPGRVLSEIVYPNIPVKNGVVHLIQKPLMLVDRNINQLLEETSLDPIISIFKEKLQYARKNFVDKLGTQQPQITLLIPSNAAWKDAIVERALANNVSSLQNILDLHLIQEPLTTEIIRNRNPNGVASLSKNKFLYFNIITQGTNRTLTVEGDGANATVLHADIGALNGVIHIIDRVLGIPYATVGQKVATTPDLNFTYQLGNIPYAKGGRYRNFNDKLDDPTKNYTYLVPRDAAWKTLQTEQPNIFAALSKPGIAYEILDRHLVEDRNFSMADLKNSSNHTYVLQTKNGGLNIRVAADPKDRKNGYTILWNGYEVGVFRPDVPCINGYVHIIDRVLIRPEDLKNIPVTDGASRDAISFSMLLLFILPLGMMVYYH